MLATWVLTVAGLTTSSAAISAFVRPRARSRSTSRQAAAAAIGLAILFAVELLGVPFYERAGLGDWVVQLTAAALSAVGLAAAVAAVARRRAPQPV